MGPTEPDPLTPELQEAEQTLEAALADACAAKPASEIDTGELIHVEEMLAVASEAAKRAVSLRRRRRVDSEDRGGGAGAEGRQAGRVAMADAEAAASQTAIHRTFTGMHGVTWDVFAVYPEARLSPHSKLKGTFSQGWLCYDCGVEKRRLSPIPENWQALSDRELERLADSAEVASRKRGRSGTEPGPTNRLPSDG